MYPAPADQVSAFWAGLRGHLRRLGVAGVPDRLTVPKDVTAHWTDLDLLLSQTCGYPLTHELAGRVRLIGTLCYDAEGCEGPFYTSLLVVRAGESAESLADMRGRRAAYNQHGSQSGWNALRALAAPHARDGRFFGSTLESGEHRRSLLLVRTGAADIAAVDCVTYALLARHEPEAVRGLRIMGRTASGVPGLPLVTSVHAPAGDIEALRRAFTAACQDESLAESREALLISGFEALPLDAYAVCPRMEEEARSLGYPELA